METINWDVFTHHPQYGYPYIIEDIGVGYILNINDIYPFHCRLYTDHYEELTYANTSAFGYHTNKYK
jgi:hypothetical protein